MSAPEIARQGAHGCLKDHGPGAGVVMLTKTGTSPQWFYDGVQQADWTCTFGFRVTAADESVSVDGSEIQEARWFTRDEL